MSLLANRVLDLLDHEGVPYQVLHHATDYTAQRTAADTHTPGAAFAKTVIVRIDGRHAMFVIPAHRRVDLSRAIDMLGEHVSLAFEEEFGELFPDCEPGAEPPFGNLYGMDVSVSPELAEDALITFNAGTHTDAVRMTFADFEQLVNPRWADVTI